MYTFTREAQRERYDELISEYACKVANRFPNAKDFTESDIRDFMVDHDKFDVHEFRTWL